MSLYTTKDLKNGLRRGVCAHLFQAFTSWSSDMFTVFVDMVTFSAIGYALFMGAKWTERTVRSMREDDSRHAEPERLV